jgi:hypothetical protein
MRNNLPRATSVLLVLVLGLAFGILVLMMPLRAQAASTEQVITFSGQKVPSIFDGLVPNHFALYVAHRRNKLHNLSSWEEKMTDLHLGARFLEACDTCQPTSCFGSFERTVPCSGCCTDEIGCNGVNNYQTDSKNNQESDQVQNEPCGADCCDDYANC